MSKFQMYVETENDNTTVFGDSEAECNLKMREWRRHCKGGKITAKEIVRCD